MDRFVKEWFKKSKADVKNNFIRYLVVSLVSIGLFLVWERAVEELTANEEEALAAGAEIIESRIKQTFQDEMFVLASMSRDWELQEGTEKTQWDRRAMDVCRHFNFQAVEWVDGTIVKWIVPLSGNEAAIDLDLSFEQSRLQAIEYANSTGEVAIGGPMTLVQGGAGLILFAPIFIGDRPVGFTVGVIRTFDHFDKMFADLDEYGVEISAKDRVLYESPKRYETSVQKKINVGGFYFDVVFSRKLSAAGYLGNFAIGVILAAICGMFLAGLTLGRSE
jgi:sensor domain CHASE-containing protein